MEVYKKAIKVILEFVIRGILLSGITVLFFVDLFIVK